MSSSKIESKDIESTAKEVETKSEKVEVNSVEETGEADAESSDKAVKEEEGLPNEESANGETEGGEEGSQKLKRKMKQYQIQKWTKDEDALIIFYKEEKKYSWKTIANLIGNKHSWQAVQMRYLRSHKQRNEQWTKLEEVRLINAIKRDWERRWTRISSELGNSFNIARCLEKITDLSKNIEDDRVTKLFESREIIYKKPRLDTNGKPIYESGVSYEDNKSTDIKDVESHKKLMLVYMGLDSISYDSDDEENQEK